MKPNRRKSKKKWSSGKAGGGSSNIKAPTIHDLFGKKIHNFKEHEAEYVDMRAIEAPTAYKQHTIKFTNKDGQEKQFGSYCFAFNSETEAMENKKYCPCCVVDANDISKGRVSYLSHVINRDLQEDIGEKPKKSEKSTKDGFKHPECKVRTPVEIMKLPSGQATVLGGLEQLNKHKIDGKKVPMEIDDPKYGMDFSVSFDSSKAGADMYSIQKGDKTPLSKTEKKYLVTDMFSVIPNFLNSQKEGDLYYAEKEEIRKSLIRLGFLDEDGSVAENESEEYEEDEEEGEEEWEDDEVIEKKKKGKKRKGKKKKSSDNDDEDDDEPKKKKGKKGKNKKKKKKVTEDDDDDSEW